jgi:hypothetical protein
MIVYALNKKFGTMHFSEHGAKMALLPAKLTWELFASGCNPDMPISIVDVGHSINA